MTQRIAVVLMNLGGPDSLAAVRPFLRNLFSDPAIISFPQPFRNIFAQMISRTRAQKTKDIYQKIGGKSPLLANTMAQQKALFQLLSHEWPDREVDVFIAMRYWHPFVSETVAQVKKFNPTQIILLPLYPQYSITTTGSIFTEWHKQAKKQSLQALTQEIQSYPQDPSFIEAHVDLILPWIKKSTPYGRPRLLFSAHGLPKKVVEKGDPYENQVHQTAQAISQKLPDIETVVCYQSKVGPLKWLGPSTEQTLIKAGQEKVPVIVVPISFVSEHSETLVELDQDYRALAEAAGIPFYGRVSALGIHPIYILALGGLVKSEIISLRR